MKVKGEHEDMIYPVREFISKIQKICDKEFEDLIERLVADGFPADERSIDRVFDYVYNSDPDTDPFTMEEYYDFDYVREFRRQQQYSKALKKYLGVRNYAML